MQHASRFIQLSALAFGIAGALAVGQAHASGFQLKENSVKSMGAAFAGAGVNETDSSVVANNPATMARFSGTTMQADVTAIDLSYEFKGTGTDAIGRPMTGGNGGDAGDIAAVPALSVIHKLDNGLAFGAMVSAPFGLKTEYDNDWVGRYYAHTSDVEIVDLTLAAALDIVPDRFSVGAGIIYSRADVTLSKSVDFGSLLFSNPATRPLPFARPQAADGFAEIQGDDTGFGWTVGANFKPTDKLAIGVSYRSEIDYELEGTADWTVPGNVAAVFSASPTTRPLFQDGAALAKLTTPSVLNVDLRYDFTDSFSMMASYAETGWESLREVRIEFANPDPDSVEPFNWKDTTFASLGAEYKLNESWTLRGGVAYDETPTHIETRTPRLPDANRMWYSLGASWAATQALEVNFGYTRIEPNSPKIDLHSETSLQSLVGPFDGAANLYGVSAQYKF
ncbi:OmpP1/FadL family transporter [Lysobacter auxotrophicus]|uniref:Outer membrane protein transport protein n=1 Tax=Lysobacter auxotrophicus TaxID=2992573 RepID=A0ABM8DIY8_9GAMM|nr:outer membrane protein transport protein [Lysobacter auxotrophicus]BDU18363.1 outer membrane protein transport protein [Lysobacter auxotrophicus]